jgi:hypothetical protein
MGTETKENFYAKIWFEDAKNKQMVGGKEYKITQEQYGFLFSLLEALS